VCLANPHEQTTVPSATGDEMPCLKSEHKAKKRALGYLRMNMVDIQPQRNISTDETEMYYI
jgi:hypothetical protein